MTILAGQALEDQCSKKACQNGGECIQVKYGRYKCDSQGTKHYSNHCEIVAFHLLFKLMQLSFGLKLPFRR